MRQAKGISFVGGLFSLLFMGVFLTPGSWGCGGGGGGGGGGEGTTLSGTLRVTGSSLAAVRSGLSLKAQEVSDCTGYRVHLLDLDDKSEEVIDVNADCTFSGEIEGGESYVVSFLDDEYQYLGTLVPDTDVSNAGTDAVNMGLQTGSSGATLGDVTLSTADHTAAGSGVTEEMIDPRFIAAAEDGIPRGLEEGNGNRNDSNDGDHSGESPDPGSADDGYDPDADNDGVVDVLDSDNDNDGINDDTEGVGSSGGDGGGCIPLDRMTLFTNNKVPAITIIGGTYTTWDAYTVAIHMHPKSEYTVNSITVSGPDYLSNLHAHFGLYENYEEMGYEYPPEQWGWDGTLEWNPSAEIGSFTAWINGVSEEEAATRGIEAVNLGEEIREGDVYVFTVETTAGTYTCMKKINGVFREVPKAVSLDGVPETDGKWTNTDITDGVTFTWSIDDLLALGWVGLDYNIALWPVDDQCVAGDGFPYPTDAMNAEAPDECFKGDGDFSDLETLTIPRNCLPGIDEGISIWQFDITGYKYDNSAYQGGKFTTGGAFPAGCP